MSWFKRQTSEPVDASGEKKVKTEGLWVKCEGCRQIIWKKELEVTCTSARSATSIYASTRAARLAQLLDEGHYEEFGNNLVSTDPLKFTDLKPYAGASEQAQKDTGLKDAIINARGLLKGQPVIVSAMAYGFIGGSMGAVVGETITRAIEAGLEERMPVIVVSSSGGARMMEGVVSLMTMAKISSALAKLDDAKVPTFRC